MGCSENSASQDKCERSYIVANNNGKAACIYDSQRRRCTVSKEKVTCVRKPAPVPKPSTAPTTSPAPSPVWSDARCAAFDGKAAMPKGEWCSENSASQDKCERSYIVANNNGKAACIYDSQ